MKRDGTLLPSTKDLISLSSSGLAPHTPHMKAIMAAACESAYEAKRQALSREIRELRESFAFGVSLGRGLRVERPNSDGPVLNVIAGPNGSGKTTFAREAAAQGWLDGCDYINPDQIAQDEFGSWNDRDAILKAAHRAEEMRRDALAAGRSLAFETVFSAPDKLEFLREAGAAGYVIRFFFIATSSPAINAGRVAQRVLEGGHDVPVTKIISRYKGSMKNAAAALTFVDHGYVLDNSVDGRPAQLGFRTSDGIPGPECFQQILWTGMLRDRLISAMHD